MKNRRITIVAFLLLAALTLGIGYAALTDTLTIAGSASVGENAGQDAFEDDIYFSKAISDTTRVAANILSDNDKAEMKAADGAAPLKVVGDEMVATFTIKSDSDLNAGVTANVTGTDGNALDQTYFKVTTSWGDKEQTLAAGQTIDITVTIKLVKTPEGAKSTAFTVELTATAK